MLKRKKRICSYCEKLFLYEKGFFRCPKCRKLKETILSPQYTQKIRCGGWQSRKYKL